MKNLITVAVLLIFVGCTKSPEPIPCQRVSPDPCQENQAQEIDIINTILSSYQEVDVMLVQESYEDIFSDYEDWLSECISDIDTTVYERLETQNQISIDWCSEQIPEHSIITTEELQCLRANEAYTNRFGSTKYLAISQPVIDKEGRAILVLLDSDCSLEIAVLYQASLQWELLCKVCIFIC